jgi:hypothetical protein
MFRAFLAAALALAAQPASAAVVFQGASLFFFAYAEAGGTAPSGAYQGNYQDLTGQSQSATLPSAPMKGEAIAQASFAKDGALLSRASATGTATADFASAADLKLSSTGTYNTEVTAAGGLDPQVFAGASPMYYYSFFYNFTIDTPMQAVFTHSSDADYEGQFAIGGTNAFSHFLDGPGSISEVLAPGSYGMELFIYTHAGDSLQQTGSRAGSFLADYKLTLTPSNAAVPETATWLMLILGIGTAGAALRRRALLEGSRASA